VTEEELILKFLVLHSKALKSVEQCRVIIDDLQHRAYTFKKLYVHCGDRKCRRQRRCIGADLRCIRDGKPPLSTKELRRLKRDFRRSPTKC
jgi:hypothetical protein